MKIKFSHEKTENYSIALKFLMKNSETYISDVDFDEKKIT